MGNHPSSTRSFAAARGTQVHANSSTAADHASNKDGKDDGSCRRRRKLRFLSWSTAASRRNSNSNKPSSRLPPPPPPYIFGTLCLNNVADLERALVQHHHQHQTSSWLSRRTPRQLIPKTIQMGGAFLHHLPTTTVVAAQHRRRHQRSVRRLLRRGCCQLQLQGDHAHAPRRL